MCVMNTMMGNEVQRLYCCSMLVDRLKSLEARDLINDSCSITIILCVNLYSINIRKAHG